MREIELIPDARNLMESTRSIGYSLSAAVADIVDNSIAAQAEKVDIWTPTTSQQCLMILDDGFGMNLEELQTAMRYGSRYVGDLRSKDDLGRFGLGLKMASLSQCRRLTVLSKKRGYSIVGARWDLEHVANSSIPWSLQILDDEDLQKVPWHERLSKQISGTLVIWEDLDVLFLGINREGINASLIEKIKDLQVHLSLVFHRYIAGETGKNFTLNFNGRDLDALDPFLIGRSQKPFAPDSYRLAGQKVVIEPFILPHPKLLTYEEREQAGDLQRDQGFYVYRNKRLVIWGTWFRLSRKFSLSKLARVRVDIPASVEIDKLWSLDVRKSNAMIPEELKLALKKTVEKLGLRSSQVWERRARVEMTRDAFWKQNRFAEGSVSYSINEENSIVRQFIERMPEIRNLLRIVSARLPLDSIYTDVSKDKVIESSEQDLEGLIREMKAAGLDTSVLEKSNFK